MVKIPSLNSTRWMKNETGLYANNVKHLVGWPFTSSIKDNVQNVKPYRRLKFKLQRGSSLY